MADNNEDDLGNRHHLLNRTVETDDMTYESQLSKRKTLDNKWQEEEDQKKSRMMKIILLIVFLVLVIVGIIATIVGLNNLNTGKAIENIPDYNMFTIKSSTVGHNQATFMLESKVKGTSFNEARKVDSTIGEIKEDSNNKFIDNLQCDIAMVGGGIMRTTFRDSDDPTRWDVTNLDGFMPNRGPDPLTQLDSVGFNVAPTNGDFGVKITDQVSKKTMIDTNKRALVFTDKYIEYGMTLPSQTLFGLGQHNSKFLLSEGNWTLFNRDQPFSPEATGDGKAHLYGTHPFLMAKTEDNKFIGILFYNSNPQQVYIKFSSSGKSVITYRTIGGILDIYTFSADTADNIIMKYNDMVGHPSLPPFWSLGFHQCSWQYNSIEELHDVVGNYTSNGYMFDTIWTDIMYMEEYIDFTVNDTSFHDVKDFIDVLHSNHHYFVPIVDAGISIKTDSKGVNWYNKGKEKDVFIKSTKYPNATDNGDLIAKVWPGFTAFVDFLHPDATNFWATGLDALYQLMPFDGLWLDMNEPANFCSDDKGNTLGECYPDEGLKSWKGVEHHMSTKARTPPVEPGAFDNTPFKPGNGELVNKTISMDAYFYDPNENATGTYVMYNIHNMYGTLETKATYEYLVKDETSKRPLIISRDSFVGHGQYGSIWMGDNDAINRDMKYSINQIMNFNMFGMPFVGGDICGFWGNTNPQLCTRWAQVGAFYPFMRNHYAIEKDPQEFYLFDEKYQVGMKESLRQRYSLLRYYYTELYKSSEFGTPTVRHPMYDWPELNEMVHDENSFLIGKHVRVIANWNEDDTTEFKAQIPKGRWLDFQTYNLIEVTKKVENKKLYNGWNYTNVHIREGSIVPIQDTSVESGVTKTYDLIRDQIRLLIVPTKSGFAQGNVYIARGEVINEKYQYFTLTYMNKKLQIRLDGGDVTDTGSDYNEVIEEIQIVDPDKDLLSADFACAITSDQTIKSLKVSSYNDTVKGTTYLKITGGVSTIQFDETHSIVFGTTGKDENICDRGYSAKQSSKSDTKHTYKLGRGGFTNEDSELTLNINLLEDNNIQLTISDGGKRFTVPSSALKEGGPKLSSDPNAKIDDYVTVSNETELFWIQIHEFQNPDVVYFEISENSLTFSDYYLSLDTEINTNGKLYGIGERIVDFFIPDGIYTTWSMDQTDPEDDGKPPGKNIYGSHPVYFTKSKTGNFTHWGMFNLNSDAQDTRVQLNTGKYGGQISHYISGQGIFDMYFFIDNKDPESAIKKYHNLIGYTLLPPFWSLGWHQCKYGYESTEVLEQVYANYTESHFPLDTLWSDIDHMLKYRDFTYDKEGSYKGLDTFVKTLHSNNRRYVPIVDAGIAIVPDGSYKAFSDGKSKGVFIQSGARNDILYGKVWPGSAAFPDWTNSKATDWWVDTMKGFHDEIEFDGIWLDMNEAANFCTGACIPEDKVAPEESIVSKVVYSPGSRDMEEKQLSLDGKHSDGWKEFNYHSLFGFMQGQATKQYFEQQNKRALIIARSTFAGQGKFTSHWLGDNFSEWKYLKYSISGILSMNVFGINFSGADICGFLGPRDEKLCQKWINVGAFYPFARSHDDIGDIGQEPYRWSDAVQVTMKHALRWRYAFLRYYYTQMYITSTEGGTFWKPLFFEFPEESHAYDDVERNVMIGPAVKFSPMLDEADDKTQKFIFPAGIWCNIIDYSCQKVSSTSDVSLPTDTSSLNLHLRPGHIIPLQRDAEQVKINTTVELNNMPMGLMINANSADNNATGHFFADDGESENTTSSTFIEMKFSYDGNKHAEINFYQKMSSYTSGYTKLDYIEFVGANYNKFYNIRKMKINGGDTIDGKWVSGNRLLYFRLTEPVEMTSIQKIEFDS